MNRLVFGTLTIASFLLPTAGASRLQTRDRAPQAAPGGAQRDVLLVGNSVSGTVSVLDATSTSFTNLGEIDVIPDIKDRMKDIHSNFRFWRGLIYKVILERQLITHLEPSGGERFVDDVFLSPDGTRLYVSRSNLGDVAAFDLLKPGLPIWRTTVRRYKADHATISRGGDRIVVSASGAAEAQVLDAATGKVIGSFKTGVLPHQNDYSHDGKHIYNGSLGRLELPYADFARKGPHLLTVVDAGTLRPFRTYTFPAGIRPSVFTRDETTMYVQLSYLNGLAKYDLVTGTFIKTLSMPLSDSAKQLYKNEDEYPHNSAHHGLAMTLDETTLCDCGTIDDNVSFVSTRDLTVLATVEKVGSMPYWATTSTDGKNCFVSLSGDNEIAVLDYASRSLVTKVKVGKFPQRNRTGQMSEAAIAILAARAPSGTAASVSPLRR